MMIFTKLYDLEKLETTERAEQGLREATGVARAVSELKCTAKR